MCVLGHACGECLHVCACVHTRVCVYVCVPFMCVFICVVEHTTYIRPSFIPKPITTIAFGVGTYVWE